MQANNSTPHLATVYDAQVRITIPYYDSFHKETINLIKATRIDPKNWLDSGCGTGTLVQKALPIFPDTQFTLADPSQEMLNVAMSKLAGMGDNRVNFLVPMGTQNLPKNMAKTDVITAIQSHHYVSPKERVRATEVCFELLTKGGVYVTFENTRPFTNEGIEIGKENWKNFQLAQGRHSDTVQKHIERFDVEYHPITVEEHLSMLRRAGFSSVEMLWYSYMQAGFYGIK